ncbi:putative sulfate transporter [Trifolium pratense]|uniref:Putative sulfate transporter n=1 Tax=Trifolium pratense TaxID=57577 RepID=A0A2K3NBN5_TRIPR|nr:putative sulfate transporter [Trifolium pratense]
MGGASVDDGGWTEMRQRRWKGFREDDEGRDRHSKTRHYHHSRSFSAPKHQCFHDRFIPGHCVRYRSPSVRRQSRYSREQRPFVRDRHQEFNQNERLFLGNQCFRPRSSNALGQRQQERRDARRSQDLWEESSRLAHHSKNRDYPRREKDHPWRGGGKENGGGGILHEKDKTGEVSKQGDVILEKGDVSKNGDVIIRNGDVSKHDANRVLGTDLKQYVSFYFTNFPAQMSNFYLRKGFEVCGMLEDVYVAKKRNNYGQPYGFIKFSNVRDVTKMMRALNNVWFGHFRVRASVAMFDRNDPGAGRRMEIKKGGEEIIKSSGKQLQHDGVFVQRAEKEGSFPAGGGHSCQARGAECKSYSSKPADADWAYNGLVATVLNGEAFSVVQNRILDAGFNDVVIIPMGANNVFMRWEKDVEPYRRGAWVRLYGIPLKAWNEHFFKLCVFECGRYLRMDVCSVDKDRLDFVQVLIATTDLDIINRVESVLVDGNRVEVKIVEEWGYAMGEDMCLVEEEMESEAAQSDCGEGQIDSEARRNVDMLVNHITDGLRDEGFDDIQGMEDEEHLDKPAGVPSLEGETDVEVERGPETSSNLRPGPRGVSGVQVAQTDLPPIKMDAQVCRAIRPFRSKRTNFCPPEVQRSGISGAATFEIDRRW